MGSLTLEKVRSDALSLSEAERAGLVDDHRDLPAPPVQAPQLTHSQRGRAPAHPSVPQGGHLTAPADPDADSAWDAEILRRLAEIDSGAAELIDREELRRRMRARMSRS